MADIIQDLSYEEAFAQLEGVLQQLENGDLPLEESLAQYEQGAALAAYCEQQLSAAELRVRQWQPEGEPSALEPWDED